MNISDILTPQLTFPSITCRSKKRVLESSAQFIANSIDGLESDDIYNALIGREKLGSTGFGGGVAIPHCRLAQCTQVTAALVTLNAGIDFDAIDRQQVDILFILLVPEDASNEHLQVLSMLAEKLQDPAFCKGLRAANTNEALYQAACH